jgi:hypothetical protein
MDIVLALDNHYVKMDLPLLNKWNVHVLRTAAAAAAAAEFYPPTSLFIFLGQENPPKFTFKVD